MKFIETCEGCYIRVDQIITMNCIKDGDDFAIQLITVGGNTVTTIKPFDTRLEAVTRINEIAKLINAEENS